MAQVYSVSEITEKLRLIFGRTPVERAVLFGSYAKGRPGPSSDVDIVIDSRGMIKGIDFFGVLQDITEALDVPVDLIEASQIVNGSRAEREIAETGIPIYEKTH